MVWKHHEARKGNLIVLKHVLLLSLSYWKLTGNTEELGQRAKDNTSRFTSSYKTCCSLSETNTWMIKAMMCLTHTTTSLGLCARQSTNGGGWAGMHRLTQYQYASDSLHIIIWDSSSDKVRNLSKSHPEKQQSEFKSRSAQSHSACYFPKRMLFSSPGPVFLNPWIYHSVGENFQNINLVVLLPTVFIFDVSSEAMEWM